MILAVFLAYTALCLMVAESMGVQKRIGKLWALFFLFFTGFIPGLIAVMLSPKTDQLPPYTGRYMFIDAIVSVVCLLLALLQIIAYNSPTTKSTYRLLTTEGDTSHYQMLWIILFLGTSLYFLNRDNRNKEFEKERKAKSFEISKSKAQLLSESY